MLVNERCVFLLPGFARSAQRSSQEHALQPSHIVLAHIKKTTFFPKAVVRELMHTLCLAILCVYSGLTDVFMLLGHRHHHTAYDRLETI